MSETKTLLCNPKAEQVLGILMCLYTECVTPKIGGYTMTLDYSAIDYTYSPLQKASRRIPGEVGLNNTHWGDIQESHCNYY